MSDNPQPQPPLQSPSPPQGYPRGPLSYPKPEAEYHEIVQNSQLFWNKLQQFSASLQTNFQSARFPKQCCERRLPRRQWREARRSSKGDAMTTKGERQEARGKRQEKRERRRLLYFLKKGDQFRVLKVKRIPLVAGTPLDLHRLFVEVTSRGGIEKVIRERKWGEVKGIFRFPSSVTSASFVLRKYYLSKLYHFEQVYYFRKEEPSVSVADPTSSNVSGSAAEHANDDSVAMDQSSVSYNLEDGNSLVGTIDAKFDYGYVISVNLGSENLNGVLYHTPALPNQFQKVNTLARPSQRIRKRQLALKDPSRPKPNRSGYNFFFAEHYATLKPSYQGQERAISKRIGILWSRLTEAEKQVYQEKGVRDKERYRAEMLEYQTSNVQPS